MTEEYDAELFDCYRDGGEPRLVPVPAFREILLRRVDRLIQEKHQIEDIPAWRALEYTMTIEEANDCINWCGTHGRMAEPGLYPCLDAVIGTTYLDPMFPDDPITITETLEAAHVILKRARRESARMGVIRRDRLMLKRAIREAKTDEDAYHIFQNAGHDLA